MKHETIIHRFAQRVIDSLRNETFARLVLSHPGPEVFPLRRVLGRLVAIRGVPTLSLTLQEPTRDVTRNLPVAEVPGWLPSQLSGGFRSVLLETTERDWQLSLPPHKPPRLVAHAPRHRVAPGRTHDQPRQEALDPSAQDWLRELGLVDAAGRVLPARADKYRQVQHYAGILQKLVRACAWPSGTRLEVADMGCGRGALTLAAWQLLRRQESLDARIVGVETRPDLVRDAQALANRLHFEGLRFAAGSIESVDLAHLDILVALHACNTATDAAIRRGVASGARLILVAPCCHQEVRPQLGAPPPLTPILQHGLMAERLAEWLTDGLRALHLEAVGYQVRMVEFVASEHTPKNLLLSGVRTDPPTPRPGAAEEIAVLKAYFGIRHHALDGLLHGP